MYQEVNKEKTKNLLRGNSCFNCELYRLQLRSTSTDWCLASSYRPSLNICRLWEKKRNEHR